MKKTIVLFLASLVLSSCGLNTDLNSSKGDSSLDKVVGTWSSLCWEDTNAGTSMIIQVQLEKTNEQVFQSRGTIFAYDQLACTGNETVTDVNNNPLPISGITPVTDIATTETLSGLPDSYILVSNQALDGNGDPDGAPFKQVIQIIGNEMFLMIIGTGVSGNSWSEWKNSSSVVVDFESNPNSQSSGVDGTVILKFTKQ